MNKKPTVFNYAKYEEMKQEIERLKKENANLRIRCRIAEDNTGVMWQGMELDKLEKFLQQNGYQYERIEQQGGIGEDLHQIKVFDEENGKELFDVICQRGSYGRARKNEIAQKIENEKRRKIKPYEEGLLEAMGSIVNEEEIGDRVEGYLTADEIIRRIKK